MSEKSLLSALRKDYGKLRPEDRKKKIRELTNESTTNRKFIQQFFPDLYVEAFPRSVTTKQDGLSP